VNPDSLQNTLFFAIPLRTKSGKIDRRRVFCPPRSVPLDSRERENEREREREREREAERFSPTTFFAVAFRVVLEMNLDVTWESRAKKSNLLNVLHKGKHSISGHARIFQHIPLQRSQIGARSGVSIISQSNFTVARERIDANIRKSATCSRSGETRELHGARLLSAWPCTVYALMTQRLTRCGINRKRKKKNKNGKKEGKKRGKKTFEGTRVRWHPRHPLRDISVHRTMRDIARTVPMIIRITRKTLERESRAFFARQCSCFHQYRTGMTCVRIPGICILPTTSLRRERFMLCLSLSLSLSFSHSSADQPLFPEGSARFRSRKRVRSGRGPRADSSRGPPAAKRRGRPQMGQRAGEGGGEGGPSSARVQDNEISRDVRRTRFHSGRGRVTRGRGGLERARDSKRGGSERARAASCATEREEPRQVGGRRPDPPILSRCVHPNRKEERIRTSEHARMHAHVSLRAMCARRNYRIIDIISEFPERILSPSSPRRKERSVRTVRSTLTV